MVGKVLAQYQISEKLGEGGMGVVWKARDTHLDRFVALKTLPAESLADPERKRRSVHEAKAASALNHPNIVHVYDIAEADGVQFISMEYVPGKTLDQLIGRKGLRLNEVLKYSVQIADALASAHSAGIIHRDLKPSNVIVAENGHVKVLDFGLAKLTEVTTGEFGETATMRGPDRPSTEEGAIVGTVAFMSPEQAEGKKVDARSDIFSFGSMLYEMLTGRQAFHGDSKLSTLSAILKEDPKPASAVAMDIPRDLEKIVTRCLRKDPARRFQHMADVKVALEELKEESDSGKLTGIIPQSARARRKSRWIWALAGTAVVLIVAMAIGVLRHRSQPPALEVVPFSTYPGVQSDPVFSPDGNQVAFAWDGGTDKNTDIYVKQIGEETPLRLTSDPAPDLSPAWSPDGRFIAFVRELASGAKYFVVPAIGGPEHELAETHDPASMIEYLTRPLEAWSPDSKWLALSLKPTAAEPFSLTLLNVDTGETRRLTRPPEQSFGDAGPAFSPKADALVFGRTLTYGVGDLHLLSLEHGLMVDGVPRQLTFDHLWSTTPAWFPDGHAILFSSGPAEWAGGIRAVWSMDPRHSGRAQRLPFTAGQSVTSVALSPRGNRLVYARQLSGASIRRISLVSGGGPTRPAHAVRIISSTYTDHNAQYSPNGDRIVFISSRSGSMEVWVAKSNGSEQVQLTHMSAPITGSPRWSPDGQRIVFDSNAGGRFQIYILNCNGGKPIRISSHLADEAVASWSVDGRWIYFTSNRSGDWQIWKMPAKGGESVQLTRRGGRVPFESRDGFVYYAKAEGDTDLWRVPAQGGSETEVIRGILWQQFSVVDNGVYFIKSDLDRARSIVFYESATGKATTLANIEGPLSFGLSISPDRRSALFSKADERGADLMLVENMR